MKNDIIKIIIYSHRVDNDGYMSAAILNKFLPDYFKRLYPDKTIHIKNSPWTYGDQTPDINYIINNYDYVYVVDIHFDNELTLKLNKHYNDNFVWIEHHALPIIEYQNYCESLAESPIVNGIQQTIKVSAHERFQNSAAELTWYYLFGCIGTERFHKHTGVAEFVDNYGYKNVNVPYIIKLISDYDTWNCFDIEKWNNEIYPYELGTKMFVKSWKDISLLLTDCCMQYYMKSLTKNPCNMREVDDTTINIINNGKIIIEYERTQTLKDLRIGKIEREFIYNDRTYKACILNTTKRSSNVFVNMENRDDYDVFICFNIMEQNDQLQYRYSMYAFKDDVNCAGMVVNGLKFNGHTHATGAQSDKFIF